jgi:hypothetical protein
MMILDRQSGLMEEAVLLEFMTQRVCFIDIETMDEQLIWKLSM